MQLHLQRLLVVAASVVITATASPVAPFEQKPLVAESQRSSDVGETASRKLTGKFLHITGISYKGNIMIVLNKY